MRRSVPPRDYIIVLASLCLSTVLVAETAHAQPKKVSGKLENFAVRARTDLFLAENPLDTGRLQSVSRTLTSPDPAGTARRSL
jgi:hypothetical protein